MAENFKGLKIWQQAQSLAIKVYEVTKKFPREEMFSLTDQLRRAAVSVAANIAEASGRWGNRDKIQLLMVARGSIMETRSHLAIALGLKYLSDADYKKLEADYDALTRSLNAFIKSLRPTNQEPTN